MRCKKHYTDLSSAAGVCASCLRQRLLSLIAAEEQAQSQPLDDKQRNLDTSQAFPRSVSPYINQRKSNHKNRHRHSLSDQLFFTTPQVRPVTGGYSDSYKKRGFIRFVSLQKIFRSKNRNTTDSVSVSDPSGDCNATSSSTSYSWFSNILHGRRHRRKHPVPVRHCQDRGMSPVRHSDSGEEEFYDASSGYASTPRRTPANPHVRRAAGTGSGGHVRNLSGLAFCLSPLVRASPNRQPDGVFSGEIRAPVKPHLSNTKSFCANRSRKLADFGRFNPNR